MATGINIQFPIRGNLNEGGVVKNAMGCVWVSSIGYTAYRWSKFGFKTGDIGTLLLGCVAGKIFLYLDEKEILQELILKVRIAIATGHEELLG